MICKTGERPISEDRDTVNLPKLIGRCCRMAENSLGAIRGRFVRHLDDPSLDIRTNHLLRALLIADRRSIDGRFYEKIRYLGASHFLALSGLHLGIIAVSASFFLNLTVPGKGLRGIILFCVLLVYSAVAGYPDSLIRAVSLYAASRMFRCLGVGSSLEDALLSGSLLVISADPRLLFSKGYQLSFLAVSAIAMIAIPLINLLDRCAPSIKRRKYLALPVSAVIVTVSVQVFTLPVVLEYFGRVPLISPASNLLFLLPVSALLHFGLLQVILPLPVARVTTAPILRILTRMLESITDFLLGLPQPEIVRGGIENLSYIGGTLLLAACLRKSCGNRSLAFLSSLVFFAFSFTAVADEPECGSRIIASAERGSSVSEFEGITTCIGNERIVIIEKILYFSSAEKYITGLWRSGIGTVGVVIYTPGIFRGRSGLALLIRRMKPKVVYCSPYVEQGFAEMAEEEGSGRIVISPVDTKVILPESFGDILLIPPETRLTPGVRVNSDKAGIGCSIENYCGC